MNLYLKSLSIDVYPIFADLDEKCFLNFRVYICPFAYRIVNYLVDILFNMDCTFVNDQLREFVQ